MGYADGVRAWLFYDPATRKFFNSSNAVFDERCFPGNSRSIDLFGEPSASVDVPDQGGDAPEPAELPAQGGDEEEADPAPLPAPAPISRSPSPELPQPAIPPPDAPDAPPAPPSAPSRSNPPRGSRPKRSLNWNALERDNTAPAHSRVSPAAQTPPPPSPASSPDPLALDSPPAAPALDLEPAPVSDDDDELRLPGALGEDLGLC